MPEVNPLLVATVIFFAALVQTLVGFGLALVAMPLLVGAVGITLAAPLVALVGLVSQVILLLRYRQALNITAIRPLAIGSVVGIPLGVVALRAADEALVTTLLGVVIVAYALAALLGPPLPEIKNTSWAYGFGLVGGLLTGAYNTGGPALVIYGNCRQWPPDEFKGNLQALILLHSVTVLAAHAVSHHFTAPVLLGFAAAVPAILGGIVAGLALGRLINAAVFQTAVLLALILLGINLII